MAAEAEKGKAYKSADELESSSVVTTSSIATGNDNRASSTRGAFDGYGALLDMTGNTAGVAIREGLINVTLTEHLPPMGDPNDGNGAFIIVKTGAGGGVGSGDVIVCGIAAPAQAYIESNANATAVNLQRLRMLSVSASVPHSDYRTTVKNQLPLGSCFRISIINLSRTRINAGTVIPIVWKAI